MESKLLFIFVWRWVIKFVEVGVIIISFVYFVNLICFIVSLVCGFKSEVEIVLFEIVCRVNGVIKVFVVGVSIICMFVFVFLK